MTCVDRAQDNKVMLLEPPMNLVPRKSNPPPQDPLKHFVGDPPEVKLEALRIDRRYSLLTRTVTVLGGSGGIGGLVAIAVQHWWKT